MYKKAVEKYGGEVGFNINESADGYILKAEVILTKKLQFCLIFCVLCVKILL